MNTEWWNEPEMSQDESDTLERREHQIKSVGKRIGFDNNNYAGILWTQKTQQCGLELISKLRVNTALYFPSARCLSRTWTSRVSTGSVSIHNRLIRNGASLVMTHANIEL